MKRLVLVKVFNDWNVSVLAILCISRWWLESRTRDES